MIVCFLGAMLAAAENDLLGKDDFSILNYPQAYSEVQSGALDDVTIFWRVVMPTRTIGSRVFVSAEEAKAMKAEHIPTGVYRLTRRAGNVVLIPRSIPTEFPTWERTRILGPVSRTTAVPFMPVTAVGRLC